MKTRKQYEAEGLPVEQVRTGARRKRGTQVRARCKGVNSPTEEVRAQMVEALPHIVRANVEKAKQGSLIHTKWLWGVVEKAPAEEQTEELKSAKASLALMLMEQLKGE